MKKLNYFILVIFLSIKAFSMHQFHKLVVTHDKNGKVALYTCNKTERECVYKGLFSNSESSLLFKNMKITQDRKTVANNVAISLMPIAGSAFVPYVLFFAPIPILSVSGVIYISLTTYDYFTQHGLPFNQISSHLIENKKLKTRNVFVLSDAEFKIFNEYVK